MVTGAPCIAMGQPRSQPGASPGPPLLGCLRGLHARFWRPRQRLERLDLRGCLPVPPCCRPTAARPAPLQMADAPAPSGERGGERGGFGRGFGGRGDRGRGDRGRGDRGRGRGRGRRDDGEEKWVPTTKLGRLVQQVRSVLLSWFLPQGWGTAEHAGHEGRGAACCNGRRRTPGSSSSSAACECGSGAELRQRGLDQGLSRRPRQPAGAKLGTAGGCSGGKAAWMAGLLAALLSVGSISVRHVPQRHRMQPCCWLEQQPHMRRGGLPAAAPGGLPAADAQPQPGRAARRAATTRRAPRPRHALPSLPPWLTPAPCLFGGLLARVCRARSRAWSRSTSSRWR